MRMSKGQSQTLFPGDKCLTACESQSLNKKWLGFLVPWGSLALSMAMIPLPGSLARGLQLHQPTSAPSD